MKSKKWIILSPILLIISIITIFFIITSSSNEVQSAITGPTCSNCGGETEAHAASIPSQGHTWFCKDCGQPIGYLEPHSGGTHSNGGKCAACGYAYEDHTSRVYTRIGTTGTHKVGCDCGTIITESENCSLNLKTVYNEPNCIQTGVGIFKCSKCNQEVTKEYIKVNGQIKFQQATGHTYGDWEETKAATCTKKGTEQRVCSVCGNTETRDIDPLGHKGGTHANGGKCTRCSTVYQTHSATTEIVRYDINGNKHTPVYKCSYSGCTGTINGTEDNHTYGNFVTKKIATCIADGEREGTCFCGAKTTDIIPATGVHDFSNTPYEYRQIDDNHHIPVYKCKNCSKTIEGSDSEIATHTYNFIGGEIIPPTCSEEGYQIGTCACGAKSKGNKRAPTGEHIGGTHDNGGKCTVCGTEYQTHIIGLNPVSYQQYNSVNHLPIYQCTCGQQVTRGLASHNYGNWTTVKAATCTEKGIQKRTCTDCGYVEQEEIPALGHTGATHANGGKCTRCSTIYETHSKSNTIVSYTKTSSNHTPEYACTVNGCTQTYSGTAQTHTYGAWTTTKEPTCTQKGTEQRTCTICSYKETRDIDPLGHTGATHANGGKCTRCNTVYEAHTKSNTVVSYIKTKDGHTPQYACTASGCTQTFTGTLQAHTITNYKDNKNETHTGTCSICSYSLTSEHSYINNVCKDCGATKQGGPTCEHTYVTKYDETNHWEECSKCKIVKTNSEKNHTYKYTKAANGEHTAECTACKYTKTEKCNYENNVCKLCGALKCEHTYVTKNDDNGHWEECSKCKEVKANSKVNHTYKYTELADGQHKAECTVCKYSKTENCSYENGTCKLCGSKQQKTPDNCSHTYVIKSDDTGHWEECSKCKQVKTNSKVNHTYKYTKLTDGKHTVECTVCKYTKTENCDYDNNTCKLCGATITPKNCEHNWEYEIDQENHWLKCTKCNEIKTDSKQKHEITTYKTNDELGTHTGTCTICKKDITEKHTGTEKCDKCGANINNNNNNNNNSNDDTTSKGKIPQTGVGITTITLIIMVAGMGIFSIRKLKTYKDVK